MGRLVPRGARLVTPRQPPAGLPAYDAGRKRGRSMFTLAPAVRALLDDVAAARGETASRALEGLILAAAETLGLAAPSYTPRRQGRPRRERP